MMFPTIRRNGSDAETLAESYSMAARAVALAREAICDAAPNARDYYPQGDGAFLEARREHEARLAKLREVEAELREIAERVMCTPFGVSSR